MMTTNLFVIANVKQLQTGGSFRILLPFFWTSWGVDILNSAIFNSFHNQGEFGTILEGLRNFGGVEPPPPRYATEFKHTSMWIQPRHKSDNTCQWLLWHKPDNTRQWLWHKPDNTCQWLLWHKPENTCQWLLQHKPDNTRQWLLRHKPDNTHQWLPITHANDFYQQGSEKLVPSINAPTVMDNVEKEESSTIYLVLIGAESKESYIYVNNFLNLVNKY